MKLHAPVPMWPGLRFASITDDTLRERGIELHIAAFEAMVSEQNRARYSLQSLRTAGGKAAPLPTYAETITQEANDDA